jgi:hypothetical protein
MHTNKLEFDTYNSDTLVFNTWFDELNIRITILDDILVQIEGYDDIRFKDLGKLNIYFGIFGIDIDPNEYDMLAYEDGAQVY